MHCMVEDPLNIDKEVNDILVCEVHLGCHPSLYKYAEDFIIE